MNIHIIANGKSAAAAVTTHNYDIATYNDFKCIYVRSCRV